MIRSGKGLYFYNWTKQAGNFKEEKVSLFFKDNFF